MYPSSGDNSQTSQRVISLNVGGSIFTTTLQTLKSDPESILAGRSAMPVLLADYYGVSDLHQKAGDCHTPIPLS